MNLTEATQYQVSGVGVIEGADIDFAQPSEFPCDACGAMVDLTSVITVTVMDADGKETGQEMSEANARVLLDQVGIPAPPVLCNQHDDAGPVLMEAL